MNNRTSTSDQSALSHPARESAKSPRATLAAAERIPENKDLTSHMATRKQIEANRRNAKRSTGPITLAGKQTVSQNATKHGLTAAPAVVLPEEEEAFRRFSATLREEWDPSGTYLEPSERLYLDRLINCAWRLKRVTRIETSLLIDLCRKQESADEATLGRAYFQGVSTLNTLSRYERQLERSVNQAQKELELFLFAKATDNSPFFVRNLKKFQPPGERELQRQMEGTRHRSSDSLKVA